MPPPQQLTMKPYAVPPASNSCSARATPATSVKAENTSSTVIAHGRPQHHPVADQRDQPLAQLARQPVVRPRPDAPPPAGRRPRRSSPRTARRPRRTPSGGRPSAMIAPTAAGDSSIAVCWAAAKDDVARGSASSGTRAGIDAPRAASNRRWTAAPTATRPMICQAWPAIAASTNTGTSTTATAIISRRRSCRSAITPAIGEISAEKPERRQQRARHPGGRVGHRVDGQRDRDRRALGRRGRGCADGEQAGDDRAARAAARRVDGSGLGCQVTGLVLRGDSGREVGDQDTARRLAAARSRRSSRRMPPRASAASRRLAGAPITISPASCVGGDVDHRPAAPSASA